MIDLSEPLPHPPLDQLEAALRQVEGWALHHHATLQAQPIGLAAAPAELRRRLDEPPPESGRPFAEILDRFTRDVAPFAFNVMHPRFLAFVPGAPCFPSIIGDWLTAAANYFTGVWLEAAGPTQVELTVVDWFKEWLGYPAQACGILTSGGSEANLTALVVARERISWSQRGKMVLYVSEGRHSSIDRAARVMGLHPGQTRVVPAAPDYRLRADALREAIRKDRAQRWLPWVVVANAGATNTGTVDPLDELAACCPEENLWLHVDAAYGWAAVLTEEGKRDLAGIAQADSVTLDPHKWLAQTFEAGCLLVRDGKLLAQTFQMRPDYLQDVTPGEGEVNLADHGIALTRRFRALKIWVSVQMLGLNWFRALAERSMRLADYAQHQLEGAGCFEILSPRQLSIVCFRYVPPQRSASREIDLDALNERLGRELLATGRAFLSSTRLNGRFALRMCFINWRTTSHDVDEIIGLLKEIGNELAARP
jgi:aromatic-L-amino-acid/L-tryptophan decarboxylase